MFGLGTLGNLIVKVTADTKGFSTKLKGLTGKAKLLGGVIAGAFSIAAIGMLAKGTMALAKRGAEVEGVTKAFEGMAAGYDGGSKVMLKALQDSSLGMVNNTKLMKQFNIASQLVSKDFAETLPDALGYLAKVAAATGTDMDFMMDSLVKGIGRLSPKWLDNLGIVVDATEAYEVFAGANGLVASQLSKTQQQTALMNQVMIKLKENTADMPEVAGTAAQSFAAFQVTMENLRDKLAIEVLPLFTVLMEGVMNALDSPAVQTAIQNFFDWLGRLIGDDSSGLVGIIGLLQSGDIEGGVEMAFGEGSYDKMMDIAGAIQGIIDAVITLIGWLSTAAGWLEKLKVLEGAYVPVGTGFSRMFGTPVSPEFGGSRNITVPAGGGGAVTNNYNYGVDLSNESKVQDILNPYIQEGVRISGGRIRI